MQSPQSYIKYLVLIIGVLFSTLIRGQDFSNKGREFWVGYGSHVAMYSSNGIPISSGGSQDMVLYFTSDHDANVTVDIPATGWKRTYKVFANQVTTTEAMPKTGAEDARIANEGLNKNGIHITSDVGIIAYAHIYNQSQSGASLLFPVTTLAREYYSLNFTQVSNSNNSYCFAYVIATEDNTNIEIIPTANTINNNMGDTIKVVLNKGEIYNIFGKLTSTRSPWLGEDLTGTKIRSVATATSPCKKIAVYSGSGKLSITCNGSAGSSDNYMQQAFPSNAWGRKYLTVPTFKMPVNYFRIAVTDPNTVVKVNGGILNAGLLKNDFYYEYTSSTPDLIESDLPIMVAQYITTSSSCGNSNFTIPGQPYAGNGANGNGDPEMIYLSPVEQTINKVTINSTSNYAIYDHYVNIVIPNKGINSLTIDGVAPTGVYSHPNDSKYSYLQFPVEAGSHTIYSDSGFNAIAYGYGYAETYGYNAGANVKDLYQTLSISNQYAIENNAITCKGSPFKAAITLPYKPISLKWKVQNYKDFIENAPLPISSSFINGKEIFKYILDTNIIYNTVGTFNFQVLANNPTADGCSGEQEINFDLTVIAPPAGNFNLITSNCIQDSITLSDNTPVGDKPVYKYFWNLGDGKFIDTFPKLKFKPNTEGTISLKYLVANTVGCLSDTISRTTIIDSAINVQYSISKFSCQNKDIVFSDLSKSRGSAIMQNWIWDYGDGAKLDTLTTNDNVKHKYAQVQMYPSGLTVQTLNGCSSSFFIPVLVHPNPNIDVKLPEVCLEDASAKFIDQTTIADNTTNQFSYLWNFNDSSFKTLPDPILLSFNATTLKNPDVKYKVPGKYIVSLRVLQDQTGCVDSSRLSFTVNGSIPKPLFYVLKDTALCSNEFVEIRDSSWVDIGSIGKLNIDWGDGTDSTIEDPSLNKIYKHFYKNITAPSSLNLNYAIKLNASSGIVCQAAVTNTVSIIPPPEYPVISTLKDYLCKSDTLVLHTLSKGGSPPFINAWTSENTNAIIRDSVITGIKPGQVQASLRVIDQKKCVYPYPNIPFFNTMLVRDIPIASIAAVDTIICNEDAITLTAQGNNPVSYFTWYLNDTLLNQTSLGSIVKNIAGRYKVTVNDGKCNSIPSAAIKISSLNITKYNFSHKPITCIGVSFPVTTNAIDQYNVHYKWDFGDGFTYLKSNPGSHKYLSKGYYSIKLNVTNDFCPKYDYQLIGSPIKVEAAVTPSNYKFFILAKQPFKLVTKTDPGYVQYNWNPIIFLDKPNQPNPTFIGDKSIDYTLMRTDTITSCTVTDEYEVIVSTQVFVNLPNAFTPNNDGLNDVLKVEYSLGVGSDFNYRIFNRWGKLLFQTKDINKGWDGRDPNGILQEMDAYNYFLEYNYIDPMTQELKIIKKTGSAILLR